MKYIVKYELLVLLLVQSILIAIGFNKIIFQPDQYVFCDKYDGAKNYFTFYSYQLDKEEPNLFKFNDMNYPYGEYIFYTDNTPLFAIGLKLFSKYVIDVSNHAIYIYNLLFIIQLLISTLLLYKILNLLLQNKLLILILSIGLIWINPQLTKLNIGHMNLSLSCLILGMIYLFLLISKSDKTKWKQNLILFLLLLSSSFIHVYYLIILCILSTSFFVIKYLITRSKINLYKLIFSGLTIPIVSVLSFFILINHIDLYYTFRLEKAQGYDWDHWKLTFESLYTPYWYNTISFPIKSNASFGYESYSYLGSFGLYGFILFIVLFLYRKNKKEILKRYFIEKAHGSFVLFLLLAGMVSLSIALGEYVRLFNGKVSFHNVLNPFFYLTMVSDVFTQFRCLGRFNWPFFWGFNIFLGYIMDQYFSGRAEKKYFLYLFLVLLLVNTIDVIKRSNLQFYDNPFSNEKLAEIKEELYEIDNKNYQAILPIPFYHVGSENYEYTIDPEDKWCVKTMQLSLALDLPLMASKMSRTAEYQNKKLINLFLTEEKNSFITGILSKKSPLLVVYNEKVLQDSSWYPKRETTIRVIEKSNDFIINAGMKSLSVYDDLAFYQWDLK